VTDTYGQIVQLLLDSINGGTHVPKMPVSIVSPEMRHDRE
jgi:hypothetical protein